MSDSEDEGAQPVAPPHDPAALNNQDLPSLFWDTMPENPEEHPDYIAMQALAEESTPEERAENFKVQGNNKLKVGLKAKNKLLLRDAIKFYGQGLELHCSDATLNAALYNNRAHVHSLLGNWRAALEDSQAVLALQPDNLKALFRGARAAAKLGQWEVCQGLTSRGLQADPRAPELVALQQEASKQQEAAAAAAAQLEQQRQEALAPVVALAAAVQQRGYQLTSPQVAVGSRRPYLDEEGYIHWPVLFTYPETLQQDVVEDWHEEDTLAEHLDVMFGPSAPPLPWDSAGEYSRPRVEMYYLTHGGKPLTQDQLVPALQGKWPDSLSEKAEVAPDPYSQNAPQWVKADEKLTLREVLLQPGHVIAGVPLFWVVAKDTEYKSRFLEQGRR